MSARNSSEWERISVTEYAARIGAGWRDESPTSCGLWVAGGQLHALSAPESAGPVIVMVVDDGGGE